MPPPKRLSVSVQLVTELQGCVAAGLFVVVPQLFASVQVTACWPPVQSPNLHCQLGVQEVVGFVVVHVCEITGFPPVQFDGVDEVTVLV